MKIIFLVLVINLFFLALAKADLPYAQKILLTAEFERSEQLIEQQIDLIKSNRGNIKRGKASYETARKLVERVFVFALEDLYKQGKKQQFLALAGLLNNPNTRAQFYYPVPLNKMFGGTKRFYAAWGDEKCINPIKIEQIQSGTVIMIDHSNLERFGVSGTELLIQLRLPNKLAPSTTKVATLAHYELDDKDPFYSIMTDLEKIDGDITHYYSCQYIESYERVEADFKKLYARYRELSKILNLDPKDFKSEKKEKSLTEDILDLLATPDTVVTPIAESSKK